jgi:hypothetical protein
MPKALPSSKPGNGGGRQGRWTDEQLRIIESVHLPRWHEFAFVENKNTPARTRQKVFTRWKQDEAETILQKPEFSILPDDVSSHRPEFDSIVKQIL